MSVLPIADASDFLCGICHLQQVDPRVLSCFHSFCLCCLQERLSNEEVLRPVSPRKRNSLRPGSPHAVDLAVEFDNETSSPKKILHFPHLSKIDQDAEIENKLSITCPVCRTVTKLSSKGVQCLLPNYILQHRMVVASLNNRDVCLLCDICASEVPANSRCSNCLVNLCLFCTDAHRLQSETCGHDLLSLKEEEGPAVLSVTRQLMCTLHPERQLTLFCTLCQQVICRDCCVLLHRGHPSEPVSRAAQAVTLKLRDSLKKTMNVHKDLGMAIAKLNSIAQRVDNRCQEVDEEIDDFVESYVNIIRRHGQQLKAQVAEARESKIKVISHHDKELRRSMENMAVVSTFGEDLITEGSDTELLSFARVLLTKLELTSKSSVTNYVPRLKLIETLNFLPDERAGTIDNKTMYGVITTQKVSPSHCVLTDEAINLLNNCRLLRKCEVILLTKDSDNHPICHGGEVVTATARYRDLSRRYVELGLKF